MDNVFIQEENKYPIGGLLPINVPAVLKGVGKRLRDRMYRTVTPQQYTKDNALNFVYGNPRMYGDPNSEALLGLYTGQDSIIANSSQAPDGLPMGRPLTASEGIRLGFSPEEFSAYDLAKYAVSDVIVPSRSKEGAYEFAYPNMSGNVSHLPENANDVSEDSWKHSHQLGTFHQTKTVDDNGAVVTYKDTYDINPFRGQSSSDDPSWKGFIDFGKKINLDRLGDIVPFGKPFEIHGSQRYDSKGRPVHKEDEGGFLYRPQTAWDSLSMKEKSDVMKVAVQRGITNLEEIRNKYNEFAEGGGLEDSIIENSSEENLLRKGGYTSSDTIRRRIAEYEGAAMTGAIDPLSGKWDKNRSFEAEEASFYDALPKSIRDKVLSNPELADNLYSYSYNVGANNFKKRVIPTLERYYQGKATVGDIEKSMWASGDAKLRGLRRRRAEERAGVRNALNPIMPIIEQPVSTYVENPYVLQQQTTVQLPQYVPSETGYGRTVELSPEQQRAIQLQDRFDRINRFNQIMKLVGIENTALPAFMPNPSIPLFEGLPEDQYAKGGKIHIKPSHRGRLTELKKRTGKTEAELYRTGSPAVRKMITFARNSRKWKHSDGGYLRGPIVEAALAHQYGGTTEPTQKMQKGLPYRYVLGEDGKWSMVDNDEMARVFQGFTATPTGNKQRFVPERIDNSPEAAARRDKFLQNRNENGTLIGEPGLELVHPEFDAIALAPLAGIAGKYAANKIGTAVAEYAAEHPGVYQYPRYAIGKFKYGFDAELPTLYRKVRNLPKVENGRLQVSNPNNRFAFDNGYGEESPILTNFTTDAPVRSHRKGNWDNFLTLSFPGRTLLGKKVVSTRPSDTFVFGDNISVPIKDVRAFTGRQKELNFLHDNGIPYTTSPDAKIYYEAAVKDYLDQAAKFSQDLQRIAAEKAEGKIPLWQPDEPIRDFNNYAREIEGLTRDAYKAPTAKDYVFMDYVFKPQYPSQTIPAVEDLTLESARKFPLFGEWAGSSQRLKYLGDPSRWKNVMYDPLTPIESDFREGLNINLKPQYRRK